MRLKKMTVSLLAAAMAVTTLAGCGAMPSTGNANGNGASENTGVASKEEEKTDGQITLQVVDWSGTFICENRIIAKCCEPF